MDPSKLDTAVLAGGCFWCLDAVYRRMNGVVDVESGYSNGKTLNPSYEDVCSGTTGHAEVVSIQFDTSVTSYAEILQVFWRVHNPTTLNRQGNDVGTQYRSGIYYQNPEQKEIAEKSKLAAEEAKLWEGKFVTEVEMLHNYFPAEKYHQDYYANNPNQGYCVYVVGEKVEKFKKLFADKLKK
ncbi:MAG: peptide-methionine (S)-S-oxide reductase MsrA [Bacteroidetes bacterium]|nr:peptide-methionine (S)-S-oxide reductase MsrA [Bacteroidota bacterium]